MGRGPARRPDPGAGPDFTLSPGSAAGCRYDVLVKYESGSKAERRNVDFCAVSELVFDGRM